MRLDRGRMLRDLKIGSVCELYEELLIIRTAAFCLIKRTLRLLGLVQLRFDCRTQSENELLRNKLILAPEPEGSF